jgi:hypothetical protein
MGQVKPNKFCHQIPKLFQEKAEVNDFAKRCITGMREFIDSIVHPADTKFDAEYLAQTRDHKNEHGDIKRQMIINALAKEFFLMGVTQAIKTTLMQKDPATLNEAIAEAMKLEDINESNSAKGKIACLAELEAKDLSKIVDDLDDLTIRLINSRRGKFVRQPFKRGN